MINEKELRPGNLYATIRNIEVTVKGIDTVNKFVVIDPLIATDYDITTKAENSIIFEDLNPIELTEKRILQMGFNGGDTISVKVVSDRGAKFEWDKKNNQLTLMDCENGIIGQAIRYVHQFQNIYYFLTGKELQLS